MTETKHIFEQVGDRADQRVIAQKISRLEELYKSLGKKRTDMSNLKSDISDMLTDSYTQFENDPTFATNIYLGTKYHTQFIHAFYEKYPYAKTSSSWRGQLSSAGSLLSAIWKVTLDAKNGNTASYFYRVHADMYPELYKD